MVETPDGDQGPPGDGGPPGLLVDRDHLVLKDPWTSETHNSAHLPK